MTVASLVSEIRAAEKVGDDPRRNRAVSALRLLFGVSLVEPCAKVQYGPYRPSDSDRANAVALVSALEAANGD